MMSSARERWLGGNEIGTIYVVEVARLGSVYSLDSHPADRSLALCAKQSGDCFFDYVPLCVKSGQMSANLKARFGAYAFRKAYAQLSDRNFHLLLAGETIPWRKG